MSNAASLSKDDRDPDHEALLRIKAKMTERQRQEMAEIVQNELVRREKQKEESSMATKLTSKSMVPTSRMSGGLSGEDLDDLYKSQDKQIQALRVKAVENRLAEAKKEHARFGMLNSNMPAINLGLPKVGTKGTGVLFALCLVVLAGVKIYSGFNALPSNDVVTSRDADTQTESPRAKLNEAKESAGTTLSQPQARVEQLPIMEQINFVDDSSDSMKQSILLQLDQRRVELEQRKVVLDEKEKELKNQVQLISEKSTELKSLIAKLSSMRKEKDQQYESRLEQLATVYSAMAPQEAASLIARLDNATAMGLLDRMPGKRMAQILGIMEQERAIELTRFLTDKRKI